MPRFMVAFGVNPNRWIDADDACSLAGRSLARIAHLAISFCRNYHSSYSIDGDDPFLSSLFLFSQILSFPAPSSVAGADDELCYAMQLSAAVRDAGGRQRERT